MLESMVSGSNFRYSILGFSDKIAGQCQPSSPDVSLASVSLITSTNWQMKTNLGSDHLPILISWQMAVTITPIQHRISINLKKINWDRYSREIEDELSTTRAFGPDKLSIFHQKHLGSRGIEYITALFTNSVDLGVIPKPDKDCSLSTSYRPISLLCPAAKVMEALLLPTINNHLVPSAAQNDFRPTSASL